VASEIEGTMSEFEAALTELIEASYTPAGATIEMRTRLARARDPAQKTRDAGHHAECSAAVDRAFRSARDNFARG
jgi:hypothetical protein